jgi:hypothetical protein|tara:strand:+ start:307 stop:633 length:327 start_codon:yes stop_codon:yes gene_type:complete
MTVYITQEMDGRNFIPARKFGDLKAVLPGNAQVILSAAPTLRKIRRALDTYNSDDYLLLSGDPVIMGLCMMVASEINGGRLQMLKWDKREYAYYPVEVDYFEKGNKDE